MKESGKPVAQRQAVSSSADRSAASDSKGVALQPPAYGIDLADRPAPRRENRTGLPDRLKDGIESLAGLSLNSVRVHYNSSAPAQLNALAYTQGTDIHVGPGQERHLAHEAWHVVQQARGRVRATTQMKGVGVNDDSGLETEADRMGGRAVQSQPKSALTLAPFLPCSEKTAASSSRHDRLALMGAACMLPIQGVFVFTSGDVKALRKLINDRPEAQLLVAIWDKDKQCHSFDSPAEAFSLISKYVDIKEIAGTIYEKLNKIIQRMIEEHDRVESRQEGYGYNNQLLEHAYRLTRYAGALQAGWKWDIGWIQYLVDQYSLILETVTHLRDTMAPARSYTFWPLPQAPLQSVDWGDDSIGHLAGSLKKLASPDLGTRFAEIGNLRDEDDEQPLSKKNGRYKGAIPYAFLRSSRRAILDLVTQVGDSVAVFSLERGGALLADHIADVTRLMSGRYIPSVKVPKSSGVTVNQEKKKEEYSRTKHQLSLVARMMDTEEGQMFVRLRARRRMQSGVPAFTMGLAETAVSGSSVNTLLGTLQSCHHLLPYSKFRLLIEKQTIKEKELVGKPLGGLRVADPGIKITDKLDVDTIPKIQMFIAQTHYILGEDVGYQVAYENQLRGTPVVVFDETGDRLIAVKLSRSDKLPRDMLRLLLMGAFDDALESIFRP